MIGLFSGISAILLSLKGEGLQDSNTQPVFSNGMRGIGQEQYVLCNVNSVYAVNHGYYIVADLIYQIHFIFLSVYYWQRRFELDQSDIEAIWVDLLLPKLSLLS